MNNADQGFIEIHITSSHKARRRRNPLTGDVQWQIKPNASGRWKDAALGYDAYLENLYKQGQQNEKDRRSKTPVPPPSP